MKALLRPCALVIAALLLPTIAAAQEASAPAPASSTPPAPAAMPDIVVLKDGSMLRGTIVELDKQKEVTIQLPTGKTRTIAMNEVTYAGAEADKPKAEAPKLQPAQSSPQGGTADGTVRPFVTVQGKPATLQLSANVPGGTYHLKSATAVAGGVTASGYQVICTAPCTATIPAGTHQLAVSEGKGDPVEAAEMTQVPGDSKVVATYTSRTGLRILGWALAGAGVVGGLWIMNETEDDGAILAAAGVIGVGFGAGILLARISDKVEISVTPTSSAPAARRTSESNAARSLVPDGVALTGKF